MTNLAVLLFLSLTAIGSAHAATFCVTAGDIAGLQSALATADSNGDDDVIELQAGVYSMPSNFLLDYEAITEHHDLTIAGGYISSFGGPCTVPAVPDARLTVLDGGSLRLRLAPGVGSLALGSLTIQNMVSADANHPPVEIVAAANSTGNITIQNSKFIGNTATSSPAVYVLAASGYVLVQNSVFAENGTFVAQSPVFLGSQQNTSSIGVEIVNSTFAKNLSSVEGARIFTPMSLAVAANDIFWGSVGGDIFLDNPSSTYLLNDDFGNLTEVANAQADSLLSVDPLLNPDFSIQDPSPVRDKGSAGGLFSPGAFDVIGNSRVWGRQPDIGAYEFQDLFFNGFEL